VDSWLNEKLLFYLFKIEMVRNIKFIVKLKANMKIVICLLIIVVRKYIKISLKAPDLIKNKTLIKSK